MNFQNLLEAETLPPLRRLQHPQPLNCLVLALRGLRYSYISPVLKYNVSGRAKCLREVLAIR